MHPCTKTLAYASFLVFVGSLDALVGCSPASANDAGDGTSSRAPSSDGGDAAVETTPTSPTPAPPSNSVSLMVSAQGMLNGKPFLPKGAAAREFGWDLQSQDTGPGISFVIGDYPHMCTADCVKGADALFFYLRGNGKSFAPFPVGTYPIVEDNVQGGRGPAPLGTVLSSHMVLGCDLTYPEMMTGSVTITASTASSVTGTFEVSSAANGPITGSFVVPLCGIADTLGCQSADATARSVVCRL